MLLSELTTSVRRLALVGLAKNTGKTETLAALLRELDAEGRLIGVTSVGRDGEERDVIDSRIEKPRVRLGAGGLVATTDALLSVSGIAHTVLENTGLRTPLGVVLIARLRERGTIEVAGPSAAEDVRAVSDAMLDHGAEQVLIDGAIDRRAASSPAVTDGLVMSTGAVLAPELEQVVSLTAGAVELVRLPLLEDPAVRALALGEERGRRGSSTLVGEDYDTLELAARFALSSEEADIAEALGSSPSAHWLIVAGALPEPFMQRLLRARRGRDGELVLVVADSTHVFLSERSPEWYARQGLEIRTLTAISLAAITVNPIAPQSHRFESEPLRAALAERIGEVPIFDVLDPDYISATRATTAPL
ncbi:MAG TPA: hypothetical protein VHY83_11075 [Solirubrobacteraceae bacterium]|nr:hypothetical protein [Solirubrobacteraceae bacterium]